jgi:hypothetical protein
MRSMSDSKTEAAAALAAHGRAIDELHKKLAVMPGCAKDRLAAAVAKYKNAHQAFEDDALECISS